MKSTLNQVALILGYPGAESTPWEELRYEHMAALRAKLAVRYKPAAANKALSAVRGVLKAAWRMGVVDSDHYARAVAVPNIKGTRLPAGRALSAGELTALFRACEDDTAAGHRDAAAFTLLFGCGLRRAEAASIQLADYNPETGAVRVVGKGNQERQAYVAGGAQAALDDWVSIRGLQEGPLLTPVNQTGVVRIAPISPQAIMARLTRRARMAGIEHCTPHDLRRSFVSQLLDAGADIASVQRLAGHASPTTTVRYDRRGEETQRRAAALLHVPYRRPAGRQRRP